VALTAALHQKSHQAEMGQQAVQPTQQPLAATQVKGRAKHAAAAATAAAPATMALHMPKVPSLAPPKQQRRGASRVVWLSIILTAVRCSLQAQAHPEAHRRLQWTDLPTPRAAAVQRLNISSKGK